MRLAFAALLLGAVCAVPGVAAEKTGPPPLVTTLPASKNQTVVLTDRGVEPRELRMKLDDSGLFFLNKSQESLATIEIDYRGKETHCASSNLEITEDGYIRSVRPFPPREFASVCFHDKGTYQYKVFGLRANPKGIAGTITVE
jgi:hypothetical protein